MKKSFSCLLVVVFLISGCSSSSISEKEPSGTPVFVDQDAGKVWNIFGMKIVGKVMSEETNGNYSVVVSTSNPGVGPPMHVHEDEDELFYVIQGKYEFTCGERFIEADAGDFVHLPRGIAHGFKNVGDGEGILMNTMTPGGFEKFLEEVDRLPKDKPLDKAKVAEIAAGYKLTFVQ